MQGTMIEFIGQTLKKLKNLNAVFFIAKNKQENSDQSPFMLICIINTQKPMSGQNIGTQWL